MKTFYTLLILFIPYVGFGQNFQEIIVDSVSTGFDESSLDFTNDGFIVTTNDGELVYDANSLKKLILTLSNENEFLISYDLENNEPHCCKEGF